MITGKCNTNSSRRLTQKKFFDVVEKQELSNKILLNYLLFSLKLYYVNYLERKKERKQDELFYYVIIQLFRNKVLRIA